MAQWRIQKFGIGYRRVRDGVWGRGYALSAENV